MSKPYQSLALCSSPGSWVKAEDGRVYLPFVTANGTLGGIYRAPDDGLARAVKPGWQSRPTRVLASLIASGIVVCESALERDAYLHLEFDPKVRTYRVQPYTIEYDTHPKLKTFPDAEVIGSDGRWTIIQIKMKATYEKHLSKPHFRNEGSLFRSLGWNYRVLTEREIRIEPRLKNLKLMHRYRDLDMPAPLVAEMVELVRSRIGVTILQIVQALRHLDVHLVNVVSLVAQRLLWIDLDKPIGDDTMVYQA